jgi:C1A family cysteine protease
MTTHKLGWFPDKPDDRDFKFSLPRAMLRKLPPIAGVENLCPSIYQQGDLGSCVGNAVASQISLVHIKNKLPDPIPSRLFIYYNAREMEGTVYEDAGCSLRDALKSVSKLGVCQEALWPYLIEKFSIRPPLSCYTDAMKDKVISYHRILYSLASMKGCIFAGFPFSIGVRVFENFPMETSTGNIPMPQGREVGGHAMVAVGYDDTIQQFIVRNSWGTEWGISGYGKIPYEYLINPLLSMDFWTIRIVE